MEKSAKKPIRSCVYDNLTQVTVMILIIIFTKRRNVEDRMRLCVLLDGRHVEPFIKKAQRRGMLEPHVMHALSQDPDLHQPILQEWIQQADQQNFAV